MVLTAPTEASLRRTWRPALPLHLRATLGPLCRGHRDPTMTFPSPAEAWRATRTPEGPAATRIRVRATAGEVDIEGWGPGARWALDAAPALLGADDDVDDFQPEHPMVRRLHREHAGIRITRSMAVAEALVPTVLEQKVVGAEAR